jgi:hypothetical protein
MFKGKHNIFFMVSKVDGEKIKKVDKATMVCRSGAPINLNIVTQECDFDRTVSYPYTFTILVANTKHGEEGTGEFSLGVYATDPKITMKQMPME